METCYNLVIQSSGPKIIFDFWLSDLMILELNVKDQVWVIFEKKENETDHLVQGNKVQRWSNLAQIWST